MKFQLEGLNIYCLCFSGGRGVTVGPILSKDGRSDIFCDNEHGANFLFKNNGNGTFTDVAAESGMYDFKLE